ncbi:MAG: RNA methyltransferase [Firmicutes bacterium]|nr:RNA methyltransferase [Bacillota bacterium]
MVIYMELTSVNNDKVKFWQKLNQKKYRNIEKLFLVEDEHLVNESLKKGVVKEIITLDQSKSYDVPTFFVTEKIMKLISSQITGAKVIAVCRYLEERDVCGNVILLDRLQDPGNLGTIIRSAVAFNFDSIILSDDSVDLYNPKVIRASEGMLFHVNIIRTNLVNFLNDLDNDYMKITTDVVNGKNIKDINYKKCAIVIGNEGQGVSDIIKNMCDEKVYIKMNSNCESLNAAVTASILMYEASHE